jgi:hypothetical protein
MRRGAVASRVSERLTLRFANVTSLALSEILPELILGEAGLLDDICERTSLHFAGMAQNHDGTREPLSPKACVLSIVIYHPQPGALKC